MLCVACSLCISESIGEQKQSCATATKKWFCVAIEEHTLSIQNCVKEETHSHAPLAHPKARSHRALVHTMVMNGHSRVAALVSLEQEQ